MTERVRRESFSRLQTHPRRGIHTVGDAEAEMCLLALMPVIAECRFRSLVTLRGETYEFAWFRL